MLAEMECEGCVSCESDICEEGFVFIRMLFQIDPGGGMLVHVKHANKKRIRKQTV